MHNPLHLSIPSFSSSIHKGWQTAGASQAAGCAAGEEVGLQTSAPLCESPRPGKGTGSHHLTDFSVGAHRSQSYFKPLHIDLSLHSLPSSTHLSCTKCTGNTQELALPQSQLRLGIKPTNPGLVLETAWVQTNRRWPYPGEHQGGLGAFPCLPSP